MKSFKTELKITDYSEYKDEEEAAKAADEWAAELQDELAATVTIISVKEVVDHG